MKNQNIKHAAPRISRRRFLRGATAATATAVSAAAVGPWVVSSRALAAGELNILMWSDYLPEDFLAEFTDSTGIKVNYTGIGSNEEIINKMKATKGRGVDICSPTNLRSGQWVDLDLLQPFDYGRINNLENANKAMLRVGADCARSVRGRLRRALMASVFSAAADSDMPSTQAMAPSFGAW